VERGRYPSLTNSLAAVLPPLATPPQPPAGNWVRSACPIPPWFDVSFDLSTINTRTNWLRSGAFLSPRAPLFGFTDARHYPLAPRPTSHVPRPMIVGIRRRCRAPSWVQHSPPGRRSTCYEMLRFPVFSKVWRAMFSAQVNMNSEFTSIPRPALVKRDSRHKFSLQKELRRYEPRSIFPQKTAFSTPFRGVLPHPAAKSALRAEGAPHSLAAKKPSWPQRSPGQCSSSPRRPDQRGQVVRRLFPAGYCHSPTAGLAKTERGPISTSGPYVSVCHRKGDSCRQNQRIPPRSPPPVR